MFLGSFIKTLQCLSSYFYISFKTVPPFQTVSKVLACSTDSHFSHHAWTSAPRKRGWLGDMRIPLVADKTAGVSRKYGVLKEGVAFRGLFIVDGAGVVRQITVNDMPVGRSVDAAAGQGVPVRRRARGGVPGGVEAGRGVDEGRRGGVEGLL